METSPRPPGAAPIVLPDGYYLTHFLDLLHTASSVYDAYLEASERRFIESFHCLTEPEQRLFARLYNRKGTVFFGSKLRYADIERTEQVVEALRLKGFLRSPAAREHRACLSAMTRDQLLAVVEVESARNWRKSRLVAEAAAHGFERFSRCPHYADILVTEYADILLYLSFLAFGELHLNLALYTLRDLGIRPGNGWRSTPSVRFSSPEEARSEFSFRFHSELLEASGIDALPPGLHDRSRWPEPIGAGAVRARERFAWEFAEHLRAAGDVDGAIAVLDGETSLRAVERRVRLLHATRGKEAVQPILENLLVDPPSSDVLLFAEDFWTRKFEGRRTSVVTDAIRSARGIELDSRFRGSPERGALEYFEAEGADVFRSENHLWLSLFGIVFWEELFAGEGAAIHSEFERIPKDLREGTFCSRNEAAIEGKLKLLRDGDPGELVRRVVERYEGTRNGVFGWYPSLVSTLVPFVESANRAGADVGRVLREIARDWDGNSYGFPDLLVLRESGPSFIEIKAEGDSLSRKQLRQLSLLSECGFPSEVVRVRWNDGDGQTYVVVDVESTGGSAGTDRIIEIAAVKICGGVTVDSFSSLVNPQRTIPSFITHLTGITNEMVRDAPPFSEVAERLAELLNEAIFVGHNVRFDHAFVAAEFRRLGIRFRAPTYCTCVGMRKVFPGLPSYKLSSLCEYFGVLMEGKHRAMEDARATVELLRILLDGGRVDSHAPPGTRHVKSDSRSSRPRPTPSGQAR